MLWNWYTIDACFISEDWHVTTPGGFAVSCFGAWGLVMVFELLRRLVKEYDIWLVRKRVMAAAPAGTSRLMVSSPSGGGNNSKNEMTTSLASGIFKPTISEQAIKSLLYTMQFTVAYFIMLLAMHCNGFILMCIFMGAYTGCFVSHWEKLGGE